MKEKFTPQPRFEDIVAEAEQQINRAGYELEQKFLQCIVGHREKYPVNEFLFEVGGVPVITRGDLHTIGAKQKGGKTSFVTILIAAMLSGQWDRVRSLTRKSAILYVDTEMKQYDTQQLGRKAARMAGVRTATMERRVHLVNFRPLTPAEMEQGIRYFIGRFSPSLVIIDGVVDLCANFNDVEASQRLVLDFLMKTAEEHQCAIVSVLHTNKTDGYSELRGHLGAFFEQKGATVIKCDKDDANNLVTVHFPTHRYAPVPDLHFTFSASDGTPVPAEDLYARIQQEEQLSREEKKAAEKQALYEQRAQVILSVIREHGGSIERKELVEEAMKRIRAKNSLVCALLKKMRDSDAPLIVEDSKTIMLANS